METARSNYLSVYWAFTEILPESVLVDTTWVGLPPVVTDHQVVDCKPHKQQFPYCNATTNMDNIYIYIYTQTQTHAHRHIYMYVCLCVCVCICVCVRFPVQEFPLVDYSPGRFGPNVNFLFFQRLVLIRSDLALGPRPAAGKRFYRDCVSQVLWNLTDHLKLLLKHPMLHQPETSHPHFCGLWLWRLKRGKGSIISFLSQLSSAILLSYC